MAAHLRELDIATERVIATARSFSDEDVAEASLLPGWTRGHVLTHLARNADGLRLLAEHAQQGREGTPEMYAGGAEGRAAAIEAGADRTPEELVDDLVGASTRLRAVAARLEGPALDRELTLLSGATLKAGDIPLGRIRELEIHHVDLDAGYTPAHWSADFTRRTLDQVTEFFREHRQLPVSHLQATGSGRSWQLGPTGGTVTGDAAALLGWLVGRTDGEGLAWDGDGPLPAVPAWS